MSSLVFTVDDEMRTTYTTVIDPATIDAAAFAATTHLIQEFVPKAHEARVTVVGRTPLAVAVRSTSEAGRVAALTQAGTLAADWRPAFEQVPRHLFVPDFFTIDGQWVSADDPAQHDRWLAAVYSDEPLTTQIMTAPGTDLSWPTSSSTRPSLMARMLGLLDVADEHRVSEIGTGTGYNAALLSHRLGDAHVTSIDIDHTLVETARGRLAGLGYRPHLSAGDGSAGVADQAPYERIIATCGVPEIPPEWITQLMTGGLIVTDVRGELGSSLVVARKSTPHSVTGRFLTSSGHFMWMRAQADNPLRNRGGFGGVFDFTEPSTDTARIPLAAFDDEDFRFVLQLAVPGLGPVGHAIRDGREGMGRTWTSRPVPIRTDRP